MENENSSEVLRCISFRDNFLPGRISAEGFLGDDPRSLQEIIDADSRTIAGHDTSHTALAARMRRLTEAGAAGLGSPVLMDGCLEVTVNEARGRISCPFADPCAAQKRLTCVVNHMNGRAISWSDLNIHLIEKHGFFEGKGAGFRVDPEDLFAVIG